MYWTDNGKFIRSTLNKFVLYRGPHVTVKTESYSDVVFLKRTIVLRFPVGTVPMYFTQTSSEAGSSEFLSVKTGRRDTYRDPSLI